MTKRQGRDDLIVVVPDSHAEKTFESLLARHHSLGIRSIRFNVQLFVRRDPGCLLQSHDFLRPFQNKYDYAIVAFDRHGCGQDQQSREELEQQVQDRLNASGWSNRSTVIVFDPELEIWAWSDSPEVDAVLGWADRRPQLRQWLVDHGHWNDGEPKPLDPKAAMEVALREVKRATSASLFRQLAQRVSLSRCIDPAFDKLRTTLCDWFPVGP